MLAPVYVNSSNLDAIGWELNKLFIRFRSGETYSYADVPFDYFNAMQKVESAGKYFHKMIRGNFHYTKLDADPFC